MTIQSKDQEAKLQSYMALCSFSPPVVSPKPHPLRDCVCFQPNKNQTKNLQKINK